MEFKTHMYDLPAGQVIMNDFESKEDVRVQLGIHSVKFQKDEPVFDNNPENNDTIVDISTTEEGMRLTLNQYNNSTFQFINKESDDPVVTIYGNKLEMHENQIKLLGNPTDPLDASNKQYCQLFDLPIGVILPYYGLNPPPYFLNADGSTFNQNNYPDLYAFLGNSNTLPNLNGAFLRGVDRTGFLDPQVNRPIGNIQTDSFAQHEHSYVYARANGTTGYVAASQGGPCLENQSYVSANTGLTGGVETRPKNTCINWIIKSKKINLYGEY